MTLDTFFEKFDLFADAPDAVAKMRELVLELAMQGRLVPQHAKEETAHALLKRVASIAKTRRQGADELEDTDAPFPIPETWAWVRLPRVLKKLTDGTHHSPPNNPCGAFMYVTAKNIKTDGVLLDNITYVSKEVHDEIYSRCDPSFGDVLYIKDGATTGVATINQVKEPFSMLSSVALLKPSEAIFNRYLLWAMRSPFFYAETRGAMKGAAITRVTLSVMAASLLPLPPLAEQKRIVAKVDELMALCDRLEAQQQEREGQASKLARASLARFADAPTPANLDYLFHSSFNIPPSSLRQSILTLAVQGKLVPQDPTDEPAEELLEKVRRARGALDESGDVKTKVQLAPIGPDQEPYSIPDTWLWVPLNELTELVYGKLLPATELLPEGFQVFGANGIIGRFSRYLYEDEMLLISCRGAYSGTPNISPPKCYVTNNSIVCKFFEPNACDIRFFHAVISISPREKIVTGSAQPQVTVANGIKLPIPLPPLAEQRRIVAKVEQLMALVDALETQLAASRATAGKLMEAAVAELTKIT
jgi:type I restriction enzyme S subunit